MVSWLFAVLIFTIYITGQGTFKLFELLSPVFRQLLYAWL